MKLATEEVLEDLNGFASSLKNRILNAPDRMEITGKAYYVANNGDDGNIGSKEQPWQTLERVSKADLKPGDGVFFKRNDLFRGMVFCKEGVTYGAYGEGEKPKLFTGTRNYADPLCWTLSDKEHHIYRLNEKVIDAGTLVFNEGEKHSYKLIPSYKDGYYFCRDQEEKPFVMADEMKNDLDLFCDCRSVLTHKESHQETWPVPDSRNIHNVGELYLRCDEGNPGEVFSSIEALLGHHLMVVGSANHVKIDNLCLKYCGAHAISAGGPLVKGLQVTNCEIGWIGGTIQHYFGTDPNYVQGTRGSVTRFGNGIEIYGGCEDYLCQRNYIYQVYDAGITHQFTVNNNRDCLMKKVHYTENLIEYCVYSIEYFLANVAGTKSRMEQVEMDHNILRFAGYGWGQQRHNAWTPAHIKSWNFENPARDYRIHDNLFDRSKFRLLHLCGSTKEDCPVLDHNAYVQTFGRSLGQFGADGVFEPPVLSFFETSDREIKETAGDKNPTVYYIKQD